MLLRHFRRFYMLDLRAFDDFAGRILLLVERSLAFQNPRRRLHDSFLAELALEGSSKCSAIAPKTAI